MVINTARVSIRALIVGLTLSVTLLLMLLTLAVVLYHTENIYRADSLTRARTTTERLSLQVKEALSLRQAGGSNQVNLSAIVAPVLNAQSEINSAHIYAIDSGVAVLAATFTAAGKSPIAQQLSLDELAKRTLPDLRQNEIELAFPIVTYAPNETLVGYWLLHLDDQTWQRRRIDMIGMFAFWLLLTLVIVGAIAWHSQRLITVPIARLSIALKNSSQRDNARWLPVTSPLSEIQRLIEAINDMHLRSREYIDRQQSAEHKLREMNASLEDMVADRTQALKDANKELIDTLEKLHLFQRQLVQNEKMASLGDMVAGIAHEVNTPIGLGVTASTMMLDRIQVIQQQFESKTLKASTMQRFLEDGQENLSIIYRNLQRAAELVSSFKQVAVDQSSESTRQVKLSQLIHEILISLRPRLKQLHHHIDINCPNELVVETKAGPINQILINLIMNSIIHGFEFMEEGTINIDVELMSGSQLMIRYRDNGCGMSANIRKRIFDPFVTTKRGQGGSGLGMHLVYNLVTQVLYGSISVISEPDKGAEFTIVFPVTVKGSTQ